MIYPMKIKLVTYIRLWLRNIFPWLVMLIVACKSDNQQAINPAPGEVPDQEGWNSKITATINGRVSAVIQYGHMQRYSELRVAQFDGGVEVDFYNAEGRHTSNVKSLRGALYEASNDVEALENVVVVSDSGLTLRTEKLRWDQQRQEIRTNDFVTITTAERDTLYGHGFESDQSLRNWSILRPTGVSEKKVALTSPGKAGKAAARDTSAAESSITPP